MGPFGCVELCARRAEVAVEGVDILILVLADMADHSQIRFILPGGLRFLSSVSSIPPLREMFECLFDARLVDFRLQPFLSRLDSLRLSQRLLLLELILLDVEKLAHLAENGVGFLVFLFETGNLAFLSYSLELGKSGQHRVELLFAEG